MKQKYSVLIVDDEQPTIDSLEILLGDNFDLLIARSGEEALEKIRLEPVDLVFLDITLPGMDGFDVLKEIKRYDESIDVVMLTADERARTAMRAMEFGAFHYITKPYDNDDVFLITKRVFEKKNLADEIISLKDDVQHFDSFHSIIGQDPKMRVMYSLISKVSLTDSTVLITGESGTGKELGARAIHLQSPRKDRNFKAVNCGAIPENLLESELFGHEKGAFTGADGRKIGKFEMANGGTLFLDEISAMNRTLQVKLLRVLQEKEIERVGGTKAIPIDIRIISATNVDLRKLVEAGQFREDLYYRLNVIHLHFPTLRERKSDIPLLANYFLNGFTRKFNRKITGFTDDAKEILKEYAWPGNVRELKNVIERAVVLNDDDLIKKGDLPIDLCISLEPRLESQEPFSLSGVLDTYEKKVILNVLERMDWNQTKAAEFLGIHRNTLLAKLDSLGINVKQLKQKKESPVYST